MQAYNGLERRATFQMLPISALQQRVHVRPSDAFIKAQAVLLMTHVVVFIVEPENQ